jgi:hypothetical protein
VWLAKTRYLETGRLLVYLFSAFEAMSSGKSQHFVYLLMGHGKGVRITFFVRLGTKKCLTEVRKTMLVLSKRNILEFP